MASERVLLLLALLSGAPVLAAEALVGPGVGNSDTLVSEGTKLFNRKQFPKAVDQFLKATRANPATPDTYVRLARAAMQAKQLTRACYAYRVYLKAVGDVPDRAKASAESDQCERQLKANIKGQAKDLTQKYVETKASFFAQLDEGKILGKEGAAESLRTLVEDGYLGPDLGDMAAKLGQSAVSQADEIHRQAFGAEKVAAARLRSARPLYEVASTVATSPPDAKARVAFLDGLAELGEKDYRKAEVLFTEAAKGDPANKEYVFYKGLSLFQAGERGSALRVLEGELKDDPRTAVLRAAIAVGQSGEAGAAELERLLFATRYPVEK